MHPGTADDLSNVVNLFDVERLAAQRLERTAFDYIAGGADDELTLGANQAAFQRWRLVPRVLRDVSVIETATTFLGTAVSMPVGIAPVSFQHLAHPDAELATVRAAGAAGLAFCLSTMSSRSIEDVAEAAVATDGPLWFQLYVHRDRTRSADLVHRAHAAGYRALVVTVDLPMAGNRERDRRNRLPYPQVFGNFGTAEEVRAHGGSMSTVVGGFNDASFTWADLAWLRDLTDQPLVLKGILAPDDALLAVEHGASAIVVSNHGGRQLDRTPPTADALPAIVEAVAGRAEIYLDGGVRRGTDVLTALALGARGVFIGRPAIFGLAVAGEAGVARVLESLRREVRTDMALLGIRAVDEVSPAHLQRA
jgi:4-hydroxymandelate oxidase